MATALCQINHSQILIFKGILAFHTCLKGLSRCISYVVVNKFGSELVFIIPGPNYYGNIFTWAIGVALISSTVSLDKKWQFTCRFLKKQTSIQMRSGLEMPPHSKLAVLNQLLPRHWRLDLQQNSPKTRTGQRDMDGHIHNSEERQEGWDSMQQGDHGLTAHDQMEIHWI